MGNNVRLSIIVAVYNAEQYLRECMESVVNQTVQEKEIIVINDGSTDHSLEILKEYENQYENVKVVNKNNEGTFLSRYDGMKMAKGDYIGFVDSDDVLALDMYEKMLKVAQNKKVDIVECYFAALYDGPKTKKFGLMKQRQQISSKYAGCRIASWKICQLFLEKGILSMPLWRRIYGFDSVQRTIKNIENIKDFRKKFIGIRNEDEFITPMLIFNSKTYWIVNEQLYYWRMLSKNSISKQTKESRAGRINECLNRMNAARFIQDSVMRKRENIWLKKYFIKRLKLVISYLYKECNDIGREGKIQFRKGFASFSKAEMIRCIIGQTAANKEIAVKDNLKMLIYIMTC